MIFDEVIKQLEIIIKATNKMEKLKEELDVLNEFMEDFMEEEAKDEEDSDIEQEEIGDDGEEVQESSPTKSLRDIVVDRVSH